MSLSKFSIKNFVKENLDKVSVVTIKVFFIIFVKELERRIVGKSCKHEKMAPTLTNYENIAVTLCLMSIAILRRRLWDRARVRRRATRSWLLRRKQRSEYNTLLKELHTVKTRTSSEIILEWTKQQFNQFFYDFICPY